MLNQNERRLQAARNIVKHVAEHLQADMSCELWNGEVLPLGPNARDDVRVVIRTPNAIRQMLLKPSLMTVYELFALNDIDITGTNILHAAKRWDHIRALRLPKNVNRLYLLKQAVPFLLGRAEAKSAPAFTDDVGTKHASGRDDKSLIQFHYDVSNDFYALFLDPEMVYSCAYFANDDMSLEAAQITKLDRICKKLQLKPGDRLLDIGSGWGGLICYAAKNYGVTAHGVTLSQAQLDFCNAKIAREGLADRVKVELRDYRSIETPGAYDKIAQIEMFEHIGIDNHDIHFKHMHKLLRPRGLYLHQASTRMATRDISKFRKRTQYQDVITRFIFPGGELDYIGLSTTNLERLGFEVHDIEGMREHFQRTLENWTERLYANREAANKEVGWERTRLWLAYFALFAIAFERNTVSVFQTLASKRKTGPSGLPLARADLYK